MAAKKSTKKHIDEETEPPIQEEETAQVEPEPEPIQIPVLHKDILSAPPIKTDVPGQIVYVSGNKFSKAFIRQHGLDKQAGKAVQAGQIVLPDGQIITAGPQYETRMSSELMKMAKSGILQISNFGKLAKRG